MLLLSGYHKLLAIDAEAKRKGGLLWWDDCTRHNNI